jgi:hypothetical protein
MGSSGLKFCTSPFPGDKLQIGQSGLARVINDLLTAPLKAKTVKQKKYICSQLNVLSLHILCALRNISLHDSCINYVYGMLRNPTVFYKE